MTQRIFALILENSITQLTTTANIHIKSLQILCEIELLLCDNALSFLFVKNIRFSQTKGYFFGTTFVILIV